MADSQRKIIDPQLFTYCYTDQQRRVLQAVLDAGGYRAAARLLGQAHNNVATTVQRIESNAAKDGYRPQTYTVQDRIEMGEALTAQGAATPPQVDPDPEVVEKNVSLAQSKLKRKISRFIITWAQNATPIHEGFFQSIGHYMQHTGAVFQVIPGRYKNPTSQWSAGDEDNEYWVAEVAPYLMNGRIALNDNLVVMGDIKIQPTATGPLSGLNTITGGQSGIFGHPKLQLVSVPTPQNSLPKLITTTGAVTVENYTDSKAGKKGEFHHTIGAVVVEVEGDEFHMRQINACDDGSFIDLEYEYTPDGVKKADRPLALVMGDIHADLMDPVCERITFFDKDSIVKTLDPERVVLHDWYDGYSGSHHHKGKVFINYAKHHSKRNNVQQEVERTFDKTRKWLDGKRDFFIVESNHNEHLTRWLEQGEPKNDPENAVFYHRMMYLMLQRTQMADNGAMIPNPLQILASEDDDLKDLHFLSRDDQLIIGGIDCTHHGDIGANGSRGTLKQFDLFGVKTIVGHSHSPGIEGGVFRTGTNSRLDLEYVNGASSWFHTDCLIYANGRRTLLNKVSGRWRASRRPKNP